MGSNAFDNAFGDSKGQTTGTETSFTPSAVNDTSVRADRTEETEPTTNLPGDGTVADSDKLAPNDPAGDVSIDGIAPLDRRFNLLGERTDAIIKPGDSQPGNNQLDDIPIFFVLDNRTNNTGDKLVPPVGLHDPSKTEPLAITDGNGRVITTEVGGEVGVNYSINKSLETGDIENITYPDGKVRAFKQENGQLTRVETVESRDGQRTKTVFSRDPATNKWYAEVGGLKAELPGDIQFTKDGVLSFQMDEQGKWRSERPDGTVFIEKAIQSGARVAYNDDDTIRQVVRPDQSRVECIRAGTDLTAINEIGADGKGTTWTKVGDSWVSNSDPPETRSKFEVSDNGNITYVTSDNVTHTITGSGIELNQNPNGSEFQFDKEGRFIELKDANGLRVKGITYHPETGQVVTASITNGPTGQTFKYERQGNTNEWKYTVLDFTGNVVTQDRWTGDIVIGQDGTYAYKEDARHGRNSDGLWMVFKLDGTQYQMQDNGQNGRAFFDINKNLLSVERTNGTRFDVIRANGFPTQYVETERSGEKITYTFDPSNNTYVPDNANYRPIKKVEGEGSGNTKITDINGSVRNISLDGSMLVKNEDGSAAEVDNAGFVKRTTSKGGGVVRVFNYDDKGSLASVTETRGMESRTIAGKDMSFLPDGTIKYTDTDGQKLSTTADGSWQAWQTINGKDYIVKAVSPKGALRTIIRDDNGEATSIIDTRPPSSDGRPGRSEEFHRVMENGKWSDSWGRASSDGKVESRHSVRLLDNGNYNYIDNSGKDRLSKAGGRSWEFGETMDSASIDEARDSFREVMETGIKDQPRMERLQILMARFEQRMSERMECLVMAGENQDTTAEMIEQKVARTYDQLTEMVMKDATNDSAFQSREQRVCLAEQFMFHAHDTTKMNQGSNGTCWIHAGHILGMVNHPDHMARFVKEISLNGSFTTLNNGERDSTAKTVRFSKRLFNFRGEEQRWNPDSPYSNATRSPVALIFDQALPILTGRNWGSHGGSYDGTHGVRRSIFMVTGDAMPDRDHLVDGSERKTFLKYGGMIRYAPGHMATRQLIKRDGSWFVLHDDQHGPNGDWVEYKLGNLQSWTKENAGRVRNDKPWRAKIDGDRVAPVYFPGGRGEWWDDEDGGGCQPRPRLRIIRRIFSVF